MVEDYPKSQEEFENRFSNEKACLDYLTKLRWPGGFSCPHCQSERAWLTKRGLWNCHGCGKQISVTSGTVFHRTRKPLRIWFQAMWLVTTQKYGANAIGIQRVINPGCYETTWQWLHKLRRAMVRPGRERLSGRVQVDESYVGGRKSGKRGRGAEGKAIVAIAVEDKASNNIGRIRLRHIPDASEKSLLKFVNEVVEPGSIICTDNWTGYTNLEKSSYKREIVPSLELKLPHLIASLLKRWLLGTFQGAVHPSHLEYYLDEYTFRFNRRTCRQRGKLFYRLVQQALMMDPVNEQDLKAEVPSEKDFDDWAG